MSGLIVLYVRGDTILLSLMRGDEMTGWYSAATRFFTLFAFVPRSIMGAVLPVMALQSIQRDSTKALSKSYSRSFRFLFITGLPLALGMGLLAEPIVGLLYGDQFLEAVPAIQILMLALMASFVNFAGTHALVSLNRERAVLGISAASLAINFALNLLLIPFLGHIGAAVTSVASEGLVLVLQLRLLNQELGHTAIVRGLVKPLIAGLAMAGFLLAFRDVSVVALIVPAGVIYLGILLLLRAFHADEVEIFRTLLPQGLKWLPLGRGADSE
jgi:O-antigen/teichoic acid export membrane protein